MNPYAPPRAPAMPVGYQPGASPARLEGDLLVVANGAQLPAVCLCCGARDPIEWRDQKFTYIPPWARLLGALIQLMVAKRSRFKLPLCHDCHLRWKKWNLVLGLSWVPGLLLIVLAGIVSAAGGDDASAVLFLLGLVLVLGGLLTGIALRNKRTVRAMKIDKTSTWLRGVALPARQMILAQQPYASSAYAPQVATP